MAKVKVLKENELIGGTDNSSVYPITHTKAVFNSNNKKLDQILNEIEEKVETAKNNIASNASLIDTLEISLESTNEVADTALRILTFADTVENVKIEEQFVANKFNILYDIGKNYFVALKDGKYYISFIGHENYNTTSNGVIKARKDRLFWSLDDNLIYRFDGIKLRYFAITDDERAKLLAYPAKPLNIPLATESSQGLMSAEDKRKINKETQPWTNIVWSGHNMNEFTEFGEYYIHGERTDSSDNLPILNAASGHTIEGTLKVYDSSIAGTGKDTDKVVTQILSMSNRVGGDGHIWIRTGQGSVKSNLTWSTWEKLQGIFEKNDVYNLDDLDSYTTNGMYSGLYASIEPATHADIQFFPGDTFLMITMNGYAATPFGTPQITQLLYKLPVKTSILEHNAEMYIRTGSWNATDKKWVWGTFSKMATNDDLSAQVAALTSEIDEKVAQAQELATEAKTDAARAQGTADSALSEATEGKSAAANAFTAANNAQSTADAAQEKNAEQDERLMRIENSVSHLFIAGRYWDEDNATPTAAGHYGSLETLRYLSKRLGLGRYLVTDDRKRKKLDPKDSTKYLDGSPAKLDGSEGQCMWCWNGFYANIWHEGSRLIKAVTFDEPIGGETSVWIPAGGISWLGAGVIDRGDAPYMNKTKWKLCSVISDDERYRGGGGTAIEASKYSKAPADTTPQITMLGMPATNTNTTDFGTYARRRGEGWEANWFVARFVVEFLFEVIMGTENSQEAFNANKDANGLYQGGFGIGVTTMSGWNGYNGTYPLIPTSVGLDAGDGVCLVPYSLPQTDGAEGEAYNTFNVPVFFGLVGAGFGNFFQWTRGIIIDVGETKSLVYVSASMYADYDPNTVADKIHVAECSRVSGYITRKSYRGLCCIPTETGGSSATRYADNFYTDSDNTYKGLRVRAAGGSAGSNVDAGSSCTRIYSGDTTAAPSFSSPLCYFTEDPKIPRSQSIANNS